VDISGHSRMSGHLVCPDKTAVKCRGQGHVGPGQMRPHMQRKSAIGKETIEQPEVPQKKEDEDNEILAVHLLLVQVRKAR
jgi:hypothetical protein